MRILKAAGADTKEPRGGRTQKGQSRFRLCPCRYRPGLGGLQLSEKVYGREPERIHIAFASEPGGDSIDGSDVVKISPEVCLVVGILDAEADRRVRVVNEVYVILLFALDPILGHNPQLQSEIAVHTDRSGVG